MARKALLIDTDILIDYLKSIQPARALLDSPQFDFYYSAWTRKELLQNLDYESRNEERSR